MFSVHGKLNILQLWWHWHKSCWIALCTFVSDTPPHGHGQPLDMKWISNTWNPKMKSKTIQEKFQQIWERNTKRIEINTKNHKNIQTNRNFSDTPSQGPCWPLDMKWFSKTWNSVQQSMASVSSCNYSFSLLKQYSFHEIIYLWRHVSVYFPNICLVCL